MNDLEMLRSISFEAHKHHFMLHMGLEKASDVIKWADDMIRRLDEPPGEIIEISEASGEAELDLRHRLELLMKHPKEIEPLRPVFGAMAAGLEAGRLQAHEVVGKLVEYGVTDSTGSRLLPADLVRWVDALVYECVNIHYVYPGSMLHQGVEEFRYDVFAGFKSLAETGTYHYRIRPSVQRAREASDATVKPIPHHVSRDASLPKRLSSWLRRGGQS